MSLIHRFDQGEQVQYDGPLIHNFEEQERYFEEQVQYDGPLINSFKEYQEETYFEEENE